MNFSAWEKLPQNYEAVNASFIDTTFNKGQALSVTEI